MLAAAQIYFNLFDVEGNDQIKLQEFKLMLGLLLNAELLLMSEEELCATETHIDALFLTINLSKTGTLDFEEFKKFFMSILMTTSQLRYSRASTQENLRSKRAITISD